MTPISGGFENNLWLVSDAHGKHVVRAPKTLKTEVHFEKILSITKLASSLRVAPLLKSYDKKRQELCLEYIDTMSWPTYQDNQAPYRATMKILRIFHETPQATHNKPKTYAPFDFIFNLTKGFDQTRMPKQFLEALEKINDIYEELRPWLEKNAVLYHGDFHKGNVLLEKTTGHPFLIDFDCVAYGHPYFDITKFTLTLAQEERLELFKSYLGKKPSKEQLRHFRLVDLVTIVVIAVNRYHWGEKEGKLSKTEMEAICEAKDNPSFLKVTFADPSPDARLKGSIYAIQEFFSRLESSF